MILWIIIGAIALVVIWIVAVYNGLVNLGTRTDEAWSDIIVQLKRRYDLIPNLVKTVQGYAKHEKTVFEKVTEARSAAMGATDPKEMQKAENSLTGALKSLFAVAESYPDLKASDNFKSLQESLTDTENKIENSRRFYNANVRDLNIKIKTFPNNMFVGRLGYKPRSLFEVDTAMSEKIKDAPVVEV